MAPISRDDLKQIAAEAVAQAQAVHVQPPAQISEKTTFSWPVVVALVTLAVAVAGVGAKATAADQDAGQARVEVAEHEKRIRLLEQQAAQTTAVLERLEKKVDKLDAKLDAKK